MEPISTIPTTNHREDANLLLHQSISTARRDAYQPATELARRLPSGIELFKVRETKEPNNDLAEAVLYAARDQGLSFKVSTANVLTLTRPLIVSEQEVIKALDIIETAISSPSRETGLPS